MAIDIVKVYTMCLVGKCSLYNRRLHLRRSYGVTHTIFKQWNNPGFIGMGYLFSRIGFVRSSLSTVIVLPP